MRKQHDKGHRLSPVAHIGAKGVAHEPSVANAEPARLVRSSALRKWGAGLGLSSVLWASLSACSGGTSGSSANFAGSPGSGGAVAAAGSGAGGAPVASGGAGTSGSSAAGANSAGAPSGGSNGTSGGASGGTSGGASGSASGGTSGSSSVAGAGGAGSHPAKVLIYAIATGFYHASIPAAAMAISQAATGAGLAVDLVPPMFTAANKSVPVPSDFTPQALAAYGAVVLLSTSGEALGSPGTAEIKALGDFVSGGGGLVVINNATHAYDSGANTSAAYIALNGADYSGQSAYGPGTCSPVGTNPSVKMLPAMFDINDEIYNFKMINSDIQPVLQCKNTPTAAPRTVSWVRTQGAGRVFFTALGKEDHSWQPPELLVPNHVLPGLLWTMGR